MIHDIRWFEKEDGELVLQYRHPYLGLSNPPKEIWIDVPRVKQVKPKETCCSKWQNVRRTNGRDINYCPECGRKVELKPNEHNHYLADMQGMADERSE